MSRAPQAARRLNEKPQMIRRWIREGRLRSPLPRWLRVTATGEPMPNVVAVLRRRRGSH